MADTWTCAACGAVHEGDAFEWGFAAPYHWLEERDGEEGLLTEDLCTIVTGDHTDYFVRGLLVLQIEDGGSFGIGAWTTLSKANFARYVDEPGADGPAQGDPWFGWFANSVPGYPDTVNLETNIHLSGEGLRPRIEVLPGAHPLAHDQQHGISLARARELSAAFWHA